VSSELPKVHAHPTCLVTLTVIPVQQHPVAMPLTILTDSDVRSLLHKLSKQDVLDLQQSLADGLHYYSTAIEEDSNACCSSYQPMRTALKRNDGQTTLFMPASSNDGIGFKVVTLATEDAKTKTDSSSITSSLKAASLSDSARSDGSFAQPQSLASSKSTTPKGTLQLLDKDGSPRALINAEEITAFRTALASTMLFKKRHNVHDVVVFGAGKTSVSISLVSGLTVCRQTSILAHPPCLDATLY
jgi:ornithine cyclodeaminase/alanine dehydrogenase-like protein (mu-crystallin family)